VLFRSVLEVFRFGARKYAASELDVPTVLTVNVGTPEDAKFENVDAPFEPIVNAVCNTFCAVPEPPAAATLKTISPPAPVPVPCAPVIVNGYAAADALVCPATTD